MTDTPETETSAPSSTDHAEASSSDANARAGAVDTGRRIDPSLLQTQRKGSTRRGGRPAPAESEIQAPEGVEGSAGGLRVVEVKGGRKGPPSDAVVVDANTIAARAAEAPQAERPRQEGRGGERREGRGGERGGERGRGGDRGGRRDGGRGGRGGERGDRSDRGERSAPRGPDFSGMAPIVVQRDESPGDFAAMLTEFGTFERVDLRIGDRVKATCEHIGSDTVFFRLSATQTAYAPITDYLDDKTNEMKIKPGQTVDAFITALKGGVLVSSKLGKDQIDVTMLEEARAAGIPIDGTIASVNKGGYEVTLRGAARGFCPIGQIDINFVDDPASFVGKTLAFLVKEVKESGRNIVLSRRGLLEKERAEKAAALKDKLAIGLQLQGTITRIQPFGCFVDLGGLDGMIPVSELGWSRVGDPSEVVKVGELVKVEITRIDDDPKRPGQQRIGLSLKATQQDPLSSHLPDLGPDSEHVGRVTRLEPFGAFVELFPGVEGLVHVSEISDRRIRHPGDVLKPDEHVKVRVKEVDLARRRVSLSMKEARGEAEGPGIVEDKKPGHKLGRGARVDGVVDRIEKYGVFLKLFRDGSDEELGQALMPASETGTPRGADLHKAFPLGTRLPVLILDVDERGRLKASKTALEQADERALVEKYKNDSKGGGGTGLGTFADLLKAKFQK